MPYSPEYKLSKASLITFVRELSGANYRVNYALGLPMTVLTTGQPAEKTRYIDNLAVEGRVPVAPGARASSIFPMGIICDVSRESLHPGRHARVCTGTAFPSDSRTLAAVHRDEGGHEIRAHRAVERDRPPAQRRVRWRLCAVGVASECVRRICGRVDRCRCFVVELIRDRDQLWRERGRGVRSRGLFCVLRTCEQFDVPYVTGQT